MEKGLIRSTHVAERTLTASEDDEFLWFTQARERPRAVFCSICNWLEEVRYDFGYSGNTTRFGDLE